MYSELKLRALFELLTRVKSVFNAKQNGKCHVGNDAIKRLSDSFDKLFKAIIALITTDADSLVRDMETHQFISWLTDRFIKDNPLNSSTDQLFTNHVSMYIIFKLIEFSELINVNRNSIDSNRNSIDSNRNSVNLDIPRLADKCLCDIEGNIETAIRDLANSIDGYF